MNTLLTSARSGMMLRFALQCDMVTMPALETGLHLSICLWVGLRRAYHVL
jgi:hypothetical protein